MLVSMKKLTIVAVTLTATAMFGLTACGDDSSPKKSAPSQGDADYDRMQQFIKCMAKQGVDVPEPAADQGGDKDSNIEKPDGGSKAKAEAARAACAKYAPSDDINEDITEADKDLALKKAECLRNKGVNAKDPKPGTLDVTIEGTADNDKLVKAFSACNKQIGADEG
ncbi:hypothetical protein OG785_38000 [Streptomyces sp. NBC_00006]|uniref:hypothetical protein n=1 Tax=unclassified Streptomyces TaxID=2593676 RepID=UPI0022553CA9|nr:MULTISPECIES: hypothetical protein [unclassified Streptomyces]MCX4831818.1 hypothetical protein [Streptomyces sp. NBC_01016]MCX5536340.1 hypothetical protein [Streptomyces sp. NBC_00006]